MTVLDIPRYKTRSVPERFIFNNVLLILSVAVAVYMIIYINYWLLGAEVSILINILFITTWTLIIIVSSIASYVKFSQYYYVIYNEHIELHEVKVRSINISSISSIVYMDNIIDRMFKTGTIKLVMNDHSLVKLRNISDGNQVFFYLQKMIRH